MNRRDASLSLIALGAIHLAAWAQVPAKRPVIGVQVGGSRESSEQYVGRFQQGLRDLGLVEGQNIDVQYRYADGDVTRVPTLVQELVRLKPDVIVTGIISATVEARRATATIPIVSPTLSDPVGTGLIASFARPGGNVTGVLLTLDSLPGKLLQLTVETIPGTTSIGMLFHVGSQASRDHRRNAEAAAPALAVKLVTEEVRSRADFDRAFQSMVREHVQAVLIFADVLFFTERREIAALAAAARLPTVSGNREHVEIGGLLSYGVSLRENWRRAATYVDKILKGAKPSHLPVEFPSKLELVVNLKTARSLGLTIPKELLLRADEVIQ